MMTSSTGGTSIFWHDSIYRVLLCCVHIFKSPNIICEIVCIPCKPSCANCKSEHQHKPLCWGTRSALLSAGEIGECLHRHSWLWLYAHIPFWARTAPMSIQKCVCARMDLTRPLHKSVHKHLVAVKLANNNIDLKIPSRRWMRLGDIAHVSYGLYMILAKREHIMGYAFMTLNGFEFIAFISYDDNIYIILYI